MSPAYNIAQSMTPLEYSVYCKIANGEYRSSFRCGNGQEKRTINRLIKKGLIREAGKIWEVVKAAAT